MTAPQQTIGDQQVPVADVKVGRRFRKDLGNIDALAASMRELGLLQPIGVAVDRELVFGLRRLTAAKKLGWKEIPARLVEVDRLLAERDENHVRKEFTPSERVAIAEAIKARVGERRGRPTAKKTEKNREIPVGQETDDYAARTAGFGNDATYRQAKVVSDTASAPLREAMDDGSISIALAAQITKRYDENQQREIVHRVRAEQAAGKRSVNAKQVVRKLTREAAVTKIQNEPEPLPTGPFRVIAADPPWSYEKRKDDGTQRGQITYPTMTVEEICALPVRDRAHEDCVLWLWITNAHLIEGAHVPILKAWDFIGKTLLTWDKGRIGTGDWLRGQTEHCILAVRGRPVVDLTNESTLLRAPPREHSRKPEEFYGLVEKLCPGSKLEMFARTRRAGWTAWGAEPETFEPVLVSPPPANTQSSADTAALLVDHLRRFRFATGTEAEMQAGMERVLGDSGFSYMREVDLGPRARVDFLVEGSIAVELKIDGAAAEVARQLERYAASDQVKSIVLVTTKAKHQELPDTIKGKPLTVHWQGGLG